MNQVVNRHKLGRYQGYRNGSMVAELYSLLITLDGPCQMERTEHSHPNNTLMQSYMYIKGKPYLIRPIISHY